MEVIIAKIFSLMITVKTMITFFIYIFVQIPISPASSNTKNSIHNLAPREIEYQVMIYKILVFVTFELIDNTILDLLQLSPTALIK